MLAERRRHRNLTCEDLARIAHVKVSQIRRLEEGCWVPEPAQALSLAEVLGLDPDTFAEWALRQLFLRPDWLAEHVLAAEAA